MRAAFADELARPDARPDVVGAEVGAEAPPRGDLEARRRAQPGTRGQCAFCEGLFIRFEEGVELIGGAEVDPGLRFAAAVLEV